MSPIIRKAIHADLPAITDIYNEAVLNSTATFDTEAKKPEEREIWFNAHDSMHPLLVAEAEGKVVGWAALSAWSDRCSYRETTENSVYIHKDFRGRGIGKALLKELLDEGRKAGVHTVLARIADKNPTSLKLHESFGFKRIGTMVEVGFKFGRRLDVELLQILL